MGTIAEKLAYLDSTKSQIALAIESKGVDVADSDTFRSYADKIRSIETGGGGSDTDVGYWVTTVNVFPGFDTNYTAVSHGQNADGNWLWTLEGGSGGSLKFSTYNQLLKGGEVATLDSLSALLKDTYTERLPVILVMRGDNFQNAFDGCMTPVIKFVFSDFVKSYRGGGSSANFNSMFNNTNFYTIDLTGLPLTTALGTNCGSMFSKARVRTITFDSTPKTMSNNNRVDLSRMFFDCVLLKTVDLSQYTFSGNEEVIASYMFYGCKSITDIKLPTVSALETPTTSNSLKVDSMFYGDTLLVSIDLSGLRRHVQGGNMFYGCTSLATVNGLSSLNPAIGISDYSSVFSNMFVNCTSLASVDLSAVSVSSANVPYIYHTFDGCTSLASVTMPSIWKSGGFCFTDCNKLVSIVGLDHMQESTSLAFNNMFKGAGRDTDGLSIDLSHLAGSTLGNNYDDMLTNGKFTKVDLSGINVTLSGSTRPLATSQTTCGLFRMNGSAFTNTTTSTSSSTKFKFANYINAPIEMKNCTFTGNSFGNFFSYSHASSIDLTGSTFQLAASSAATGMNLYSLFEDVSNVTSLNLGGMILSPVMYSSYMFSGCTSLATLNLDGFRLATGANTEYMFSGCTALENGTVYLRNSDENTVNVISGLLPNATIVTE